MDRMTQVANPSDLVPLSVLELDLPAPVTGWGIELDRRGVSIMQDDIGRDSITRAAARDLILEHRDELARQARHREEVERQAVADDQRFRAQLPGGIPWHEIPHGATAADVWAQAEKDALPKRTSVLEHALERTPGLEYHPIQEDGGWVVGGGDG